MLRDLIKIMGCRFGKMVILCIKSGLLEQFGWLSLVISTIGTEISMFASKMTLESSIWHSRLEQMGNQLSSICNSIKSKWQDLMEQRKTRTLLGQVTKYKIRIRIFSIVYFGTLKNNIHGQIKWSQA